MEKKFVFRILFWIIALLVVVLWLYRCYFWILNPICNKMEEWGTINVVNSLLEGINPYVYEDVKHTYIYGPLFPVFCAYLYPILGFDIKILFFCRFINFFFALFISLIFFDIAYKYTNKNVYWGTVSALSILPVVSQSAPITAYSVSMGLLITAILLWVNLVYKGKHVIWGVVYAFLIVLSFYCKQYFIIISVPIGIHLYTENKRQFWFYSISLIFLSIIAYRITMAMAPTCLYILLSCQKVFADDNVFKQLIRQWVYFSLMYSPFFLAIFNHVKLKKMKALSSFPILLSSYFVLSTIALMKLGLNIGAYLDYYQHLLLMPLLLIGIISISRLEDIKNVNFLKFFVIVLPLCFCVYRFTPHYKVEDRNKVILKLEEIEKSGKTVMNLNPMFDDISYDNGWEGVNSLHSLSMIRMIDIDNVWLFNSVHKKYNPKILEFEKQFKEVISSHKYDIILFRQNFSTTKKIENILYENYVPVDSFDVQWGNTSLMNYVMIPIK